MKRLAPAIVAAALLAGCATPSAHTNPVNAFACHHLDQSQHRLEQRLKAREAACQAIAATCVTDANDLNRYTRNAEMLVECYPERIP